MKHLRFDVHFYEIKRKILKLQPHILNFTTFSVKRVSSEGLKFALSSASHRLVLIFTIFIFLRVFEIHFNAK